MIGRMGFMSGGDPRLWDWLLLRGLVIQWGCWQLYPLPARYRAALAAHAGAHGLRVRIDPPVGRVAGRVWLIL